MSIRRSATLFAFCVATLLALGLVMLYSASMTQEGERFLIKQSIFAGIGLVACFTAAAIDYRHLRKFVWPALAIACVLLAFTALKGREINGARRWIELPGFTFQPSEIAKAVVIVMLAHYASRYRDRMKEFWRGLVVPGALAGCALVLVLAGKDFGTTLLLGLVTWLVLLIAGARPVYLVPLGLAAFALICYLLMNNENRRTRIDAWLHPEKYEKTIAYQQLQAKYALGSGEGERIALQATAGRKPASCPSITRILFSRSSARNSASPRPWACSGFTACSAGAASTSRGARAISSGSSSSSALRSSSACKSSSTSASSR
jgi:cell division protein FtsW